MARVTFAGVSKRYGDVSVIENLNLEIQDREFMVLVGPSGCGKSTALRMIAGLEEISAGTIAIDGKVVNGLSPKDRDIAMVFQNYALYPHMTVRQNLEFGLKIRRVPREESDRLVAEAAGVLGLAQLLDRKPKQLSGGQRQRVAVGRAIVRQPAVFLFDEPLSNLDAKLRVQMRAEIKKLQKRLATTTVYVTHDQVEAMTMGQRIAVMKEGKLQQVGTPLETYDRPENLFVAGFIGAPPMNFIPATVGGGGSTLEAAGLSLPLAEGLRKPMGERQDGRIVLGIRPENVLGSRERSVGPTSPVQLVVDLVELLGDEVVVHGRSGEHVLVSRQTVHTVPELGETVEVFLELSKLHFFDAVTERRIPT